MKKGITPIIATIVLLFITMGLLAMAYAFLSGFLSPRMQKSFEIPAGSSVCVGGKITAYIYNNGQGQVFNTDFEIVQIMNSTGTIYTPTTSPFTAEPGQSKIIISAYDCGDVANGCPGGTYTIKLGAGANVLSANVRC
jgi:flagellin-like protein